MTLDWRDEKTIVAVLNYARIAVGLALAIILVAMFALERIDLERVLQAIVALLTIDRVAQGMNGAIKIRNGK